MPLDSGWWHKTVEVRRYSGTVSNYEETGEYEALYLKLPTNEQGEDSTVQDTIMGQIGLGSRQLCWRAADIDPVKGWPREKDAVILDGKEYYISRIIDHTAIPPFFTSMEPHKIAFISEEQ